MAFPTSPGWLRWAAVLSIIVHLNKFPLLLCGISFVGYAT